MSRPVHVVSSFRGLALLGAFAMAASPVLAAEAAGRNAHYISNRDPLTASPFVGLPPGAVKARGWLAEQLRLQAEGITGHLDRLFVDVGPNSAWLGGSGEAWERGPYYIRGATALAYVTRDEKIIAKVKPWLEWSLNSQQENGQFGPKTNDDWWSRMIMLQALQIHQEATGDPRVVPFMTRYFKYQLGELPRRPLKSWSQARGGDNLDSVYWLYNRTGEAWLLDLARLIADQTHDWASLFVKDEPIKSHVVNLAQGYKEPGIWYQQAKDDHHLDAVRKGLDYAMKYHGQIEGLHSGDEGTIGRSSIRGTELCAMVEYMLSMETLLKALGGADFGDRLERVAYNALPAAIAPDGKGHQYFIQPNQVLCNKADHGFRNDHGDDLVFGVLSGYPCCATNMHMGWPLLTAHLWMATPGNGLAAVAYAPSEVTAKVADGVEVTIVEETEYPFRGTVKLTVHPKREAKFPLMLRVPGWTKDAKITVGGKTQSGNPGSFVTLDREWKAGDTVMLEFPMEIKTSEWENGSVGIERGPLVYSLAVQEDWRKRPDWRRNNAEDEFPVWEIFPKSAWNYGILIDREKPAVSLKVVDSGEPLPAQPWAWGAAPVKLVAKGRKVPDWGMGEKDNAQPVPQSPVTSAEPLEEITLIPFATARIRVSYLPVLAE